MKVWPGGSTPIQDREATSGSIVHPSDSYNLALRSHLKLANVPEGFPQKKLNSEQAMVIEAALEIRIAKDKSGDIILRVVDYCFKSSLLIVNCSNEISRTWLIEAVHSGL